MRNSQIAFTIVELIVVITILAILGTIGFISFSSHLVGTRDTNRLGQLSAIHQGLDVYSTQNELPTPENSVEIKAGGSLIGYQGYAGKNVLGMIQYSKGGKDPRDELYYSYYLTEDKKHFQLMGFLEDESNKQVSLIPNTNAADYTRRYPTVIGKKLGILTETGTNSPIQEVSTIVSSGYLDVVTTTKDYKANFTDQDNVIGTGTQLIEKAVTISIPKSYKTCKEIYDNKLITRGVDGVYTIKPEGTEVQAYCDMVTNSGTNTLVLDKNYSNLDNYLVGYWDMQTTTTSGSLTVIKDFSKYKNNGTILGSMNIGTNEGINGKSTYFDGVNDYFSNSLLNGTNFPQANGTIVLWVNGNLMAQNTKSILDNRDSSRNHIFIRTYDGINYNLQIALQSTSAYVAVRDVKISDNNWNNIVVTYDTINDKFNLFVNGVKNYSSNISDTNWTPNGQNMIFGGLAGFIDEVSIYSRSLSDSEIKTIYNKMR